MPRAKEGAFQAEKGTALAAEDSLDPSPGEQATPGPDAAKVEKTEPCSEKMPAGSCSQTGGSDKMCSLTSWPQTLQEVRTIFILYLIKK